MLPPSKAEPAWRGGDWRGSEREDGPPLDADGEKPQEPSTSSSAEFEEDAATRRRERPAAELIGRDGGEDGGDDEERTRRRRLRLLRAVDAAVAGQA